MKKIRRSAAICVLLAALMLTGCTATRVTWSGRRVGSISSMRDGVIEFSCMSFEGSAKYTINVTKEQELTLNANISAEEGALSVQVQSGGIAGGAVLFDDTIAGYGTFGITLPDYGTYTIRVDADGFAGGYSFRWAAEEESGEDDIEYGDPVTEDAQNEDPGEVIWDGGQD